MKYVLALLASIFLISPILTFANDTVIPTLGSLNDEQKAALAAQAAKMVADNASGVNNVSSAKQVKEWVDIGTAIGSGLASTAKELGIAANDFVKTPVGKLTAAIIVWHFMGGSIVHIAFGTTWLLVVGSLWVFLYRRASVRVTKTEYEAGKSPNGIKRVTVRDAVKLTDGQNGTFIVGSLIIVVVGIITIATF